MQYIGKYGGFRTMYIWKNYDKADKEDSYFKYYVGGEINHEMKHARLRTMLGLLYRVPSMLKCYFT